MRNIIHVVNWGIWGGVQTVALSIAREYTEYQHHVLVIGDKIHPDFLDLMVRYGVNVKHTENLAEDLERLNAAKVFLHNTPKDLLNVPDGEYIRVHHNAGIGEWFGAKLDWFVSYTVRSKYKGNVNDEVILPPLIKTDDYKPKKRNVANPVVGKVQSTTVIGDPTPPEYMEVLKGHKTFVVGKGGTDAPVRAGMTPYYLRNIDYLAIYQDKLESWGLSLSEANLMGIPGVVKDNQDGMTEQAMESGGAILVNNPREFKEALQRLRYFTAYESVANSGEQWCRENMDVRLLRNIL